MRAGGVVLDVDGASGEVMGNDFAEGFAAGVQLVLRADGALLWRVGVPVGDVAFARPFGEPFDEAKAGERAPFIEESIFGEIAKTEVFPPFHLFLAAVPVERVGEEPEGGLFGRSIGGLDGQAGGQLVET